MKVVVLCFLALCVAFVLSDNDCQRDSWSLVTSDGTRPTDLGAHTLTSRGGNRLYFFGGFNEDFAGGVNTYSNKLYRFKKSSSRWTLIDSGTGPAPRAYHTAAYDPDTDSTFVYGGLDYSADFSHVTVFGDFWAWRHENENENGGGHWELIVANSTNPGKKGDHTMTYYNGKIYVYGGIKNAFFTDTSDLWAYDISSNVWTQLWPTATPGTEPVARHNPRLWAENRKIYLNGGEGFVAGQFVQNTDTWMFNLQTKTWTDITPVDAKNMLPYVDYAAFADKEGGMILYGGESFMGEEFSGCGAPFPQSVVNRTWTFSNSKKEYSLKTVTATPPALKRTAGAILGNCFYVSGGFQFPNCPPGQIWNNDLWALKVDFDDDD